MIRANSGVQPGDPLRVAIAIMKVADSENPLSRLLLVAGALKRTRNKIIELQNDIDIWKETTLWGDNPPI